METNEISLFEILYLASGLVVQEICLRYDSLGINNLPHDVPSRGDIGDVDPLAVEMSTVQITAVGRYSLVATRTAVSRIAADLTGAVLETEAGFVTLRHLLLRRYVQQVVVHERLERVVVAVAAVPDPLTGPQDGLEVHRPPVPVVAVKAKQFADVVGRLSVCRTREAVFLQSTSEVVHG